MAEIDNRLEQGPRRSATTGTAYVLVDEMGENQIIGSPGANLAARIVADASEIILLARLELPLETDAQFLSQRSPGSIAILNAAPFHSDAYFWIGSDRIGPADIIVVTRSNLLAIAVVRPRQSPNQTSAKWQARWSTERERLSLLRGAKTYRLRAGPNMS